MSFKTAIIYRDMNRDMFHNAFCVGLNKHGVTHDKYKHSTNKVLSNHYDLICFWAWRYESIIKTQRNRGKDVLVLERGYFNDRFKYTSLGFNGLNGHADFLNKNMPDDRWNKHGVPVKEWKNGGGNILIMGQVPGDASIKNYNLTQKYNEVVNEIRRYTDRPIIFRPHPIAAKRGRGIPVKDVKISSNSLDKDLKSAWCTVSINSNSGVDSVLAGVPAFTLDKGAMAYQVTSQDLSKIEQPYKPDRTQWLSNLGYTQWTTDEMASGEAWEHLKRKYK